MGTRLALAAAVLAAGFGLVLWRLGELQLVQAEELARRAARQHEKAIPLEGERGDILDRNGRVLATNVEVPSVYAVPTLIGDVRAAARRLARTLALNEAALLRRLGAGKSFAWVARKIDPDKAEAVRALDLPGVGFAAESERFYPKRLLLGHILGFTGVDDDGLEGLERKYNAALQGAPGEIVMTRDALGRPVLPRAPARPAARGADLVLTIDEVVQHVAERELEAAVTGTGAEAGSVIVLDPSTGEVLALAVRPGFNPNRIGAQQPEQWRNRTITDLYEPGSTFKIVTAAAALEEGATRPDELFFCENGKYRIGIQVIHDHEKHGWLTFQQVIQKSSNIGLVKVASRLGAQRLHRWARVFGFGERTGVDLAGEAAGSVKPVASWSGRTLASIAIGQEIGATPLQVATAMAAVANGGWLMRPYVVAEVRAEGKSVERVAPQPRRRVMSERTAAALTTMLATVTQPGGTGEKAAIAGYNAAGKTGTAQKIDPATGRYASDRFVVSFAGFAPIEDPRVVVLVVIDSPKGVAWGGSIAAPVFRAVVQSVLPYLGVRPTNQETLILAERAP